MPPPNDPSPTILQVDDPMSHMPAAAVDCGSVERRPVRPRRVGHSLIRSKFEMLTQPNWSCVPRR